MTVVETPEPEQIEKDDNNTRTWLIVVAVCGGVVVVILLITVGICCTKNKRVESSKVSSVTELVDHTVLRQDSDADLKNTNNKSVSSLPAVETDSGGAGVNVRTNRVDEEKPSSMNLKNNISQDVTM